MWLNIAAKLVPGMIKTGMSIASNRRRTKELESVAELKLAEKMANGEVEFKKAVIDSHRGDLKDEFCLILISIPLLLLAWSVFSDDPDIQAKIDIFFDKFSNLPMFYQALVVEQFFIDQLSDISWGTPVSWLIIIQMWLSICTPAT